MILRPLAAFLLTAGLLGCGSPPTAQKAKTAEARGTRLQTAEAMFRKRCESAGERIYRTVDDVEAVFLMKLRPSKLNFNKQFEMDDPYGRDVGGDGYIKNFLYGRNAKGSLRGSDSVKSGYRYVDAIDPKDGKRYRYTGSMKVVRRKDINAPNIKLELSRDPNFDLNIYEFMLDRVPASGPAPRYGVTYEDISTREDREYWIAGGSLKVIDLESNEVIAERIGYMMDRGQGNTSGERSPWLLAASHACPSFPKTPGGQPFKGYQTRDFIEKVLHIKQGG
jgi:hypothetical protein